MPNDWVIGYDMSATYEGERVYFDEDGNKQTEATTEYGQYVWAYREPGSHLTRYSDVSIQDDAPGEDPEAYFSDAERPVEVQRALDDVQTANENRAADWAERDEQLAEAEEAAAAEREDDNT